MASKRVSTAAVCVEALRKLLSEGVEVLLLLLCHLLLLLSLVRELCGELVHVLVGNLDAG